MPTEFSITTRQSELKIELAARTVPKMATEERLTAGKRRRKILTLTGC